ncbi:MAG: hypothetical protein E6Z28_06025 [Actinomyces urogenitalis]|uniref:hypothetical protein n=1 Tax=Actinomyces urogenitalis TaxID=103621 RepID=UPI0029089955|nr:hypothetical protein [Actinomyces urogenitalis]MDU5874573.1 hypothetical protein [Actinomyces urogenitalis]
MSDQTHQALIDAITAHIQDERPGEELGPWLLAVNTTTDNKEGSYYTGDGSIYSTIGLAQTFVNRATATHNKP